ncbi:MAG: hypothetical protein IPM13_18050 [Phycisphaerales bacterium]|nr:hypothetical protein [Phycisphaerales bacterium]
MYYAADAPGVGRELRRVALQNGVSSSALVHDIVPGAGSSSPTGLSPAPFRNLFGGDVGSLLYFAATTPTTGEELWVTEGLPGTTRMVLDLVPGTAPSWPKHITQFGAGDYVAFTATSSSRAFVTDGSAAGTREVCGSAVSVSQTHEFTQVGCDLWLVGSSG